MRKKRGSNAWEELRYLSAQDTDERAVPSVDHMFAARPSVLERAISQEVTKSGTIGPSFSADEEEFAIEHGGGASEDIHGGKAQAAATRARHIGQAEPLTCTGEGEAIEGPPGDFPRHGAPALHVQPFLAAPERRPRLGELRLLERAPPGLAHALQIEQQGSR